MATQDPHRRLRVGIVGVGNNGSQFVNAYATNPATEVVAVVDPLVARARRVAATAGDEVRVYTTFSEMLERESPDIVSVHTPDHVHADIVVAALESGSHVFCEKPLGNTVEDCTRMVAAARKRPDLTTACGHVLRMHPVFRAVRDLINERVLGDVIHLEGDYIHDLRSQQDWQLEHERPVIGGGCHPIDIMQWWAGPVTEVQAISSHRSIPAMKADDCIIALLTFESGALGRCTVSYGTAGPMAPLYNLSAYGTVATVVRDQLSIIGLEGGSVPLPVKYDTKYQYGSHQFNEEVADFIRAIETGDRPSADFVDGASAVAVGVAIEESVATGRPVRVEQPAGLLASS